MKENNFDNTNITVLSNASVMHDMKLNTDHNTEIESQANDGKILKIEVTKLIADHDINDIT